MTTRTCDTCGYVGTYTSDAFANHHFPRHSCIKMLARKNGPGRYAPTGETRSCDCPRSRHEHGDVVMYNQHRCRCDDCRRGSRERSARNLRLRAYGRHPFTDAEPARQHVAKLRAAGMGLGRISEVSGVSRTILSSLVWGNPSEGIKPTKRLRKDNAQRILAVVVDVDPRTIVDGVGTARRLQALAAIGWAATVAAPHIGMSADQLNRLTTGQQQPQRRSAELVAAAYDELWKTQPPQDTLGQRIVYHRTRNDAARRGWVGPLAWDDSDIDDPAAQPFRAKPISKKRADPERTRVDEVLVQRALAGIRVNANAVERAEILRRWRAAGRPLAELDRQQSWNVHRDVRGGKAA